MACDSSMASRYRTAAALIVASALAKALADRSAATHELWILHDPAHQGFELERLFGGLGGDSPQKAGSRSRY